MPPFPGFVGASYTAQSPNVDAEALINWYPERSESPNAKVPNCLLPTPGYSLFATLPDSPVRGAFAQNDRMFGAGGTAWVEIARDGNTTPRPMTALVTPAVPVITNSELIAAILKPDRPAVSAVGTTGATTYTYVVTALSTIPAGETEASDAGTITNGNATLDATNYNAVTWNQVVGATGYKVYRTVGGTAPPKLIGTSSSGTALMFLDDGTAGTAVTPPTVNTTGDPAGATIYGYKVSATNIVGSTDASAEGFTATGQAGLSARLYNTITWAQIPGATGYKVFRTTGGATPPMLIATITTGSTLSTRDTGQVGTAATPPSSNTTLGTGMANDGAPVSIASSGDAGRQILIASGGHGYLFDLDSNMFTPALDGATFVGYVDGFFVALDASTSTLRQSGRLDGLHWDPGVVAQRTSGADRWLSMVVIHRELWIFGSQTTEVWVNVGSSPFAFAPHPSIFIEKGIVAPYSVVACDGVPIWLGQDIQGSGTVWRANGYTPERVSTHALEWTLSQYTMLSDAEAWSYQEQGHTFYVLTFPSEGHTWVLDTTTGAWHERGSWDITTNSFKRDRPRCHAFAFSGLGVGTHLVGDRDTGRIFRMGSLLGNDINGSPIRRVRRCPHLFADGGRLMIRKVQIDLETGLGLITGQGSDPTLMMRMSSDGGKTWHSARWLSAGAMGQYKTRAIWRNWGAPRDAVFELAVSDPVPWRIAQALINNPDGVAA